MRYVLDFAKLPRNRELLEDINSAAERLYKKLLKIDVKKLLISDYNKKYLGSKLVDLTPSLQKYSYVLAWALAGQKVPKDKVVFLDYGGGSGVMSLLAKEYGIGTVIYNDIFETSCEDSRKLGEVIGVKVDHHISGDIDDVLKFLKNKGISCNAIASYDVIEHIYDIESFFSKLPLVSDGPLSIVMSSGANQYNPLVRKAEMEKQREVEFKDRRKEWGYKDRDCFEAYFNVRKKMIMKYLKKIGKNMVEDDRNKMVENTRGMIEKDIKKSIDEYLKSGVFPSKPEHPTNTCDPYTGNWAEHLMNPYGLAKILADEGFKTKVLSGFYSGSKSISKRVIGKFLNIIIYTFNNWGIVFAPSYTVFGRRDL